MSRTLTTLATFALVALITSSAVAQPPAGPPKEMSRFDAVLGYWKGSGTSAGPDGQKMPWTSVNHARKVMGGHFVRDDVIITIEAGPMKMELGFINIYAWDATRNTHVAYQFGNNGVCTANDVSWLDDDTMVQMSIGEQQGQRMMEHWKTKLGKDSISFKGTSILDTGASFVMVEGSMKRADEMKIDATRLAPFMTPVGDEMKAAARMSGQYEVTGKYSMGPGTPNVEFVGREMIRPIFGGLALENVPVGDGYEGYGIMMWNAKRKMYDRYSFNSWGIHHSSDCYPIKGGFGYNTKAEFMGQQMISRMKLMVNADGKCTESISHAIMGEGDPFMNFKATYKFAKGN